MRASRHLEADETLLASAVGRELQGRRSLVVLVTSKRIVVAWARPAPPEVILSLIECSAEFEAIGRIVTLADGRSSVSVRDVDPVDAGILVDCVEHHDIAPVRERLGQPWTVQIVED